jgi:hypothetical protein
LLRGAGYRVIEEKMTVIPIELALGLSTKGIVFKVLNRCLGLVTRLLPGLFGYQTILVATSAREAAPLTRVP